MLWSTVRLRLKKSISGHHFQIIRKLANNDFQYQREGFYSIQQYILTTKKKSSFKEFYIDLWSFLLPHVLFSPIVMNFFVIFSNACLTFEYLHCNWNLTKLDIQTLISSDCSATAQKLSKHLKKLQNIFFCLSFANSNFNVFFFTLSHYLKKKIFHNFSCH